MKVYWAVIAILVVAGLYFTYQNVLPSLIPKVESIEHFSGQTGKVEVQPLNISDLPRWGKTDLRIFIEDEFLKNDQKGFVSNFRSALSMWSDVTDNILKFQETSDKNSADIIVRWVSNLRSSSTDSLGDTDVRFTKSGQFRVISSAEINLLVAEEGKSLKSFDMTNLALHEIGHSVGLGHVDDKRSVMYPVLLIPSSKTNEISKNDTDNFKELYKIPPKTDLVVSEANASKFVFSSILKKRYFLNTSILIESIGLVDAGDSELEIMADGKSILREKIPKIEIGTIFTVSFFNVEVSKDFSKIEIIVDVGNVVDEINEENNRLTLSV